MNFPSVMGIINLSPRSFRNAFTFDSALKKSLQMIKDGAAIIDVGAVATNPFVNLNEDIPSEQQELDSLIPFIEKLSQETDAIISVDTYRAQVMKASVSAGAAMINDQHALTEENALEAAIKLNVPVCLMHHFSLSFDASRARKQAVSVFSQIVVDLQAYADRCLIAGMKKENIILDPGFGGGHFNKTADENFTILSRLEVLTALGFPVLVGLSRKSFFGKLLNKPIEERLSASIVGAVIALQKGASIIRVHDVAETVDALRVLKAIER
ncbi:MAG: dihydropteroate synthase [Coxiellaceae bacterium]|nr:dihydropteroate synthase [Coxiellaceae bacterium]